MSTDPTNYLTTLVNTYSKRGKLTPNQAQRAMDKERGTRDLLTFALTTRTPLTAAALSDLATWCDWPDNMAVKPRFAAGLTDSDRATLRSLKPSPPAEVLILTANGQPYYSPDRYTLIPGAPPYEPTEDRGDMSNYVGPWFADRDVLLEPVCLMQDNYTDMVVLKTAEILTAVSFSSLAYLFAANGHGLCLWHRAARKLDTSIPLVVRTKSGEVAGCVMPMILTSHLAKEALAYRTGGVAEWPY